MRNASAVLEPGAAPSAPAPAVSIEDLHVRFDTGSGVAHILRGVSFEAQPGEVVALAGESGSGKSTVLLSIVRLLPAGAELSGRVRVLGSDVTSLERRELRRLRAGRIRVVFQDPWSSLHPLKSVGTQLVESARVADPKLSKQAARDLAAETLVKVGIGDALSRLKSYPHEVSGGQLQRVMIAMALVASPEVLLCDEPTTALDVTTQAQVLELLRKLNEDLGLTVVIATHDVDVIADIADRLVVMYGGKVVEDGVTDGVLDAPRHPYSLSLLQAVPGADSGARLRSIEGRSPSAFSTVGGCPFAPRCDYAHDVCRTTDVQLLPLATDPHRSSACLLVDGYPKEVRP